MSASDLITDLGPQVGLSLALAAPILGLRRLALIRLSSLSTEEAQAKGGRIRLVGNFCLAAVLGFVWISELQSLLLSITAVLMALVVATRDVIQCATGSLLRMAGGSFRVGDQVSVDGTCGRVASHSLLTTTIEETDGCSFGARPTGRRLVIPNSRLFSGGIHVETGQAGLRRHALSLTLSDTASLRSLLNQAEAIAFRHRPDGAPAPWVTAGTTELGKVRLDIVLFCRAEAAALAEREIVLELLEAAGASRADVPASRPRLSIVERDAA